MSSTRCRLFHVDAFTRTRFCGNPALVVLDADDLTDQQMQTIATECNGETAFVLPAESNDHDVLLRFFSPRQEVPFVGHATIAAHYVLAKSGVRSTGITRQRSGAGISEIETQQTTGDYRIRIGMSPPSLGPVLPESHRIQVLNALGISSPSLHGRCPMQIMTKGRSRLLIGMKSADLLHSLKPNMNELARLTPHIGAEGYFIFALTGEPNQPATASRMFCPAIGIPEDPVSGNAHGMLGVYLTAHGLLATDQNKISFRGHQGASVGRPGMVDVEITTTGSVAQSVNITGDAVIVYEAQLPL